MQAWHRALLTRRRQRESGQVMVLFALALIVLVLAVGLAIDGGFGLLQYRQAQNAADFAAEAAAQALYPTCTATGNLSANELVYDINAVVATNSPSTDTGNGVGGPPFGWTGYYLASTSKPLKQAGSDIPIYSGTAYPGGNAPTGACGVHLDVSPQWPPFIAQILGVAQLKTATGASALNTAAAGSTATSIVALAENGAHTILMAGDGLFEVEGTIFDNSNGCLTSSSPQSINGGCDKWGSFSKPDILDGKQSGTMYDWGLLEYSSIVGAPWDSCFGTTPDTSVLPLAGPKEWPDPNPVANGDAPTNDAQCGANNTNVWSDYWQSGGSPKTSLSQISLPPAPTPNNAGCGGEVSNPATGSVGPTPANPPYPAYPAGTTVYYPGDYTNPVVITGNAVFYNCSQTDNITGADPPNPGVFYFDQGLVLRPGANTEVFGNDVLLVTQNPIPNGTIASSPSGVKGLDNGYQNVGDGEPTIGYGPSACTGTSTGESCSGGAATSSTPCSVNGGRAMGSTATLNCNSDANAQCSNSVCFQMNPKSSQGLNDSLEIGGAGTVDLSAPQDGDWNQFLFWQVNQANDAVGGYSSGQTIDANIGLDNLIGDSANITLNGVLVDATNFQGQDPTNEQYWGGNASLPFVSGGMLVAGYGTATGPGSKAYGIWGTGLTCGAGQPGAGGTGCQVTINGLALVGMFQTQGETQLAIDGSGTAIPGIQGSAILTG